MKTVSELRKITLNALESKILFEVETSVDNDGGYCFSSIDDAYNYVERVIKAQTNTELFKCDDFEKINYIQITMHFIENANEITPLALFARKNDTEFFESILI